MDTISRLSSIYIHIAPNSIIYTLTTIYYPSCQQISGCYNPRVQCYSQRIYIQQSNWFIFNHFGHYFQIIFNLYSYCTKFNSIHINYNILSILLTNFSCYISRVQSYSQRIYIQQSNWFIFNHFGHYFQIIFNLYSYCTKFNYIHINYNTLSILLNKFQVVITHECNVIHKEFIYSNQIGSFLTILDTISRLSSIYIHIAPNSIRYTLTTIHYPSAQQISGCYNSRVQSYSQRIYIQQSNWFIFNHFGHYFQIIFNLYSCCTKFNSILINYNTLSICSTNFSML